MSKKQQLADIKQAILDNNLTPQLRDGATQLVFGHGNPDSEIVFIGEAPGKNEDLKGEPFVGSAGKFLDEMLESIGMNREDVYISNIVKYRPPNNRDPSPEEKKAFWPYLLKEILAINPRIVVTLGRHSMEYFLPNHKISQCHGQPKRLRIKNLLGASPDVEVDEQAIETLIVLPLFHPAAALYNGSMRETLVEDFSNIPEIINIINNPKKEKITNEQTK